MSVPSSEDIRENVKNLVHDLARAMNIIREQATSIIVPIIVTNDELSRGQHYIEANTQDIIKVIPTAEQLDTWKTAMNTQIDNIKESAITRMNDKTDILITILASNDNSKPKRFNKIYSQHMFDIHVLMRETIGAMTQFWAFGLSDIIAPDMTFKQPETILGHSSWTEFSKWFRGI